MHRTSLRTRVIAGLAALATAGGSLVLLAPPAMALDADVDATAGNTFVEIGASNVPIGNVVITEDAAGDLDTGSEVCITITSANAAFNTTGDAPTVTRTGNVVVVSPATVIASEVKFGVTTASTGSPSAVTVAGLRLNTTGAGTVLADVGDCSDQDAYEANVKLAFRGTSLRLFGSDRYATAQAIAAQQFSGSERCIDDRTVVIARGDNYPDALAASYLAGVNDVPILLTAPTSIPNETLAALKHHGVKSVVLIGGTAAISQAVQDFLDALPPYDCVTGQVIAGETLSVVREFGADRFVTARSVALSGAATIVGTMDAGLDDAACNTPVKTAIVASGENFPDALAAGPLAYGGVDGACGGGPIPLLLTHQASLTPITASTLSDLGIKQVILMGGPAAVSAAVATAIGNVPGVDTVRRVQGADRQATAVALSEEILAPEHLGDWHGVPLARAFLLTRPDNFPDALAAASIGGRGKAPLFLTASPTALGTTAADGIMEYPGPFFFVAGILGGPDALSEAVVTQAKTAMTTQDD